MRFSSGKFIDPQGIGLFPKKLALQTTSRTSQFHVSLVPRQSLGTKEYRRRIWAASLPLWIEDFAW